MNVNATKFSLNKDMSPIIYGDYLSPPSRSVFMLCKDMNFKYELRETLIVKGDHLTADFLTKNPQHCLPTLEDNGKYLWESHAVMTYLVSKFGNEEQQQRLYSRNVYKRAVIDQRILFDTGVLFPCFRQVAVSLICLIYVFCELLLSDKSFIA